MKRLTQATLWSIIAGFMLLSSGCIVAPEPDRREVHDERWCNDHPHRCD